MADGIAEAIVASGVGAATISYIEKHSKGYTKLLNDKVTPVNAAIVVLSFEVTNYLFSKGVKRMFGQMASIQNPISKMLIGLIKGIKSWPMKLQGRMYPKDLPQLII